MGSKFTRNLILCIAGAILLGIASLGWVYGAAVESGDYTKVGLIRLHVLAHSDLAEDQELKRQVRDAVLEYMTPYLKTSTSKADAEQIISQHMPAIQQIAQQVVWAKGFTYPVNIELGSHQFPTKTYGNLALPAGNYQALRILIGDAAGQNWWCVLFPPLCFVDVTNATAVTQETQRISNEIKSQQAPEIRWKLLELITK